MRARLCAGLISTLRFFPNSRLRNRIGGKREGRKEEEQGKVLTSLLASPSCPFPSTLPAVPASAPGITVGVVLSQTVAVAATASIELAAGASVAIEAAMAETCEGERDVLVAAFVICVIVAEGSCEVVGCEEEAAAGSVGSEDGTAVELAAAAFGGTTAEVVMVVDDEDEKLVRISGSEEEGRVSIGEEGSVELRVLLR